MFGESLPPLLGQQALLVLLLLLLLLVLLLFLLLVQHAVVRRFLSWKLTHGGGAVLHGLKMLESWDASLGPVKKESRSLMNDLASVTSGRIGFGDPILFTSVIIYLLAQ